MYFLGTKNILLLMTAVLWLSSYCPAKTLMVDSEIEFELVQKGLQAGDTILWSEGRYSDLNLTLEASDIYFLAQKSGGVIFTGSSTLTIKGDGNIISGFQFVGGKTEGDVVDISGNNNTLKNFNIHSYDSHYYLRIRPNCQHNKIFYCNFEAKPEAQESSVVQIEATEDLPGYHVISFCSFKNHTAPPGAGGDYGIEALRIGYSYQRMFVSRTTVEYCYFEKCNGDYEIISCKARENIMRYNTFVNNGPAHLTLRHGSKNLVYGNFFINGAGVRIKEGQDHAVINNYFDTGDYMAIQLQNHHYDPVDTVYILYNTFISGSAIKLGGTGDYPPKNILLANNLFANAFDKIITDPTNTEKWANNVLQEIEKMTIPGFHVNSFDFVKNQYGLFEPPVMIKFEAFKNFKIYDIPKLDDDHTINYDIMKQKREGQFTAFPGSYLPKEILPLKYYASLENTGPDYLH
jgi:hypothetical protein